MPPQVPPSKAASLVSEYDVEDHELPTFLFIEVTVTSQTSQLKGFISLKKSHFVYGLLTIPQEMLFRFCISLTESALVLEVS